MTQEQLIKASDKKRQALTAAEEQKSEKEKNDKEARFFF